MGTRPNIHPGHFLPFDQKINELERLNAVVPWHKQTKWILVINLKNTIGYKDLAYVSGRKYVHWPTRGWVLLYFLSVKEDCHWQIRACKKLSRRKGQIFVFYLLHRQCLESFFSRLYIWKSSLFKLCRQYIP